MTLNIQAILSNKNKAGDVILPDFKLHYKAIDNKSVFFWHKSRLTDQWNRIESPKINSGMYTQFFTQKPRIYSRKDKVFSKWSWEKWIALCKGITGLMCHTMHKYKFKVD